MKSITIKQLPDHIHRDLKQRAEQNHRSLNGELLAILEAATSKQASAPMSISDFLLQSPLRESGLDLERSTDTGRDIDL